MKTKNQIVAVILVSAIIVGCSSTRPASPVATLHFNDSLMNVVIPRLALTNATIEQAVATIQEQWREQLPGKQLPLSVIIHYINSDTNGVPYEGYPGYRRTISFEARNLKVRDCLRMISSLGGQRLKLRSGMVVIEDMEWIEEDWTTEMVPVSEKGLAFLGLSNSSKSTKVTERLASYGVPFRRGFDAWWNSDIEKIVITTIPEGVSRLQGLLWLVDNGYSINKVAQPTGARDVVPAAQDP